MAQPFCRERLLAICASSPHSRKIRIAGFCDEEFSRSGLVGKRFFSRLSATRGKPQRKRLQAQDLRFSNFLHFPRRRGPPWPGRRFFVARALSPAYNGGTPFSAD